MRSAGFDPYAHVRHRESLDFEWEQSRPVCDMCGDRIYTEELYRVGPYAVCEDCIEDAWNVIRKQIPNVMRERLGAHSDWIVMEHIIERMLEAYELSDFKEEYEEQIDEH